LGRALSGGDCCQSRFGGVLRLPLQLHGGQFGLTLGNKPGRIAIKINAPRTFDHHLAVGFMGDVDAENQLYDLGVKFGIGGEDIFVDTKSSGSAARISLSIPTFSGFFGRI